mmetsp:Transcript_26419/g.47639  ORF Transcript_26419/g.47639 Transcript_26419/m.47639 type:complete len:81 (-) Transcript_26419:221-463(-)
MTLLLLPLFLKLPLTPVTVVVHVIVTTPPETATPVTIIVHLVVATLPKTNTPIAVVVQGVPAMPSATTPKAKARITHTPT